MIACACVSCAFAGLAILTLLFVVLFVPETKGVALEDIRELFSGSWLMMHLVTKKRMLELKEAERRYHHHLKEKDLTIAVAEKGYQEKPGAEGRLSCEF